MSTPVQTQILTEIAARLARITTANGYSQTLATVARARVTPFTDAELPAASVHGATDTREAAGAGWEARALAVEIDLIGRTDGAPMDAAAYAFGADAQIALARATTAPKVSDAVSPRLGGLVATWSLDTISPRTTEGSEPTVVARLTLTARYKVDPRAPFTLID